MEVFRFFKFPVYKAAVAYYKDIVKITDKINNYNLKDQAKRAALSIVLNIAEGSAVKSDKEFARYLEKSLGSINEVVACLHIMKESEFISDKLYQTMIFQSEIIAKQLGGFRKSLLS